MSAENLKSLVIGGIAFATAPGQESPLSPNTVFPLFEKPENEWLKWSPAIAVTNSKTGNSGDSPPPEFLNKIKPAD